MTALTNITIESMAATIEPVLDQIIDQMELSDQRDQADKADQTDQQAAARAQQDQLFDPERLAQSFHVYFQILANIGGFADPDSELEESAETLNYDAVGFDPAEFDASEFADYGTFLFIQLLGWNERFRLQDNTYLLHQCVLRLAQWSAQHDAKLAELPQLINSISFLANSEQNTDYLADLAHIASDIVKAVEPQLKIDEDDEYWRILNFNYGIVATRSHDSELIESVFNQLMVNIPTSAATFFSEGMEQMDLVGYPDHVRALMKNFYQLSQNRVLH